MSEIHAIKIFLVEDEAAVVAALKDRLPELGYSVIAAASGEAALEAIPAARPNLVLMDIMLGDGIDGVEAARRLRQTCDIPVVFLATHTDPAPLRQAASADPFGLLAKPFNERELHATIQMALFKHGMERRLRGANDQIETRVRERTAALADTAERLQDLFDNVSDLVQSVAPDGRFLYVNRAWRETLGYTEAEVERLRVFDVVDPSCREACHALFRRLMAGETLDPFEMTFRSREGRRILVEGRVTVRFADGRPDATRGIFRDLTSRMLAEEEYSAIVRANTSGFMMVAHDARILEVNAAFGRMLGYTADELQRMRIPDIEAAESAEDTRQHIARILATGSDRFETRHRRKDGTIIDVEISAQYLPIRGGVFIGFVSDLTEHRRAQLAQERDVEFLTALNQTTLELLSSLDKKSLLQALTRRAATLLGSACVEVALIEGENFVVHAAHGPNAPMACGHTPLAQAVLAVQALATRAPVVVADYAAVPGANAAYLQRNIRAAAVLPILRAEQCFGVLALMRSPEHPPFSADDIRRAELFASLAALVLRNTTIYDEARHAAEERTAALRESEERFRSLFEHGPMPVILAGLPEGRIVDANPAATALFGYSHKDVIGRTALSLDIWENAGSRENFLDELNRYGSVTALETRMRLQNGSTVEVLLNARLIYLAGRPHSLVMVNDITQQKQAAFALAEQRRLLRAVLDNAPIGIWMQDETGRMRFVNQAFCNAIGLPEGKFLAVPHYAELYDAATAESCMASDRAALASPAPCVSEEKVRFVDGLLHHLEIHKTRLTDEQGQVRGLIGLSLDISARKQAEEQLQRQLRHLDSMARITRISSTAGNLEEVLQKVLEEVLCLFAADRAWFLSPCDPTADAWSVPMECTRPEWPGALAIGAPLPMTPEVAAVFRDMLATTGVVQYGPGTDRPVPPSVAEKFSVRSQMQIVIRPKSGSPWLFGLHRCAQARVYGDPDVRLFAEIAQRMADILGSLIAQQGLRESEERFRSVFEKSPLALLLATVPDGRILEINAAAETSFGYGRQDVIGRTSAELQMWERPEDRARFVEMLRTHGSVSALEVMMRRRDGSTFTAQLNSSLMTFGGQACSLNAILDVTATRRARTALKRSEARLREAQYLALIGNWELDLTCNHLQWDQTLFILFKIDPAQFAATYEAFLERVHPEDRARVNESYRQSVAARTPYEVEHRLLLSGGHIRHVVERGLTEYSPDGHPLRTFGTVQDITTRKLAEEAVRRTASQFQDLFEFAPDAIVMADHRGVIVRINRRAETLFGYRREELLGTGIEQLVPEAMRAAHRRDRESYTAHAAPREMGQRQVPLFACRKDGTTFPAQISLGPIQTDEGILVAAAVRDITAQLAAEEARKQAEVQLRHAQRMESLGTLAGGIAHDFNNILTGVLGFIEVARLDVPHGHPARHAIENISAAGIRAKALVKQILTFGRKQPSDLRPVQMHAVVNEACDLVRSTIPSLIELRRRISTACPAVLADANQIHQVVINLCTNAWHALPEGSDGTITVGLETIRPADAPADGAAPGTIVRLTVSDNGTGMDPATLERIFEPFYTTKPHGKGSGLGLAVVHGIAQSHSAAIQVDSEKGKGTTVRLDFPVPASGPAAPAAPGAETQLSRGTGQSVLLVDDDQVGGEAIRCMIERLGYRVVLVRDPRDALALFKRDPAAFDLLVSDYALPGMSGDQLTAEILDIRPSLPVVLVSGNIDPLGRIRPATAGIRAILHKPLTLAELASVLSRQLQGNT
ncbi:MAG: PAS domain S-box protein [Opitutae bacterium]|nr:PAS domain S-box protein [Opitutae bacterium]